MSVGREESEPGTAHFKVAFVGRNRVEKLTCSLETQSVNTADPVVLQLCYNMVSLLQQGLERAYSTVRVPFVIAFTRVSGVVVTSIRWEDERGGDEKNQNWQKAVLPRPGKVLQRRLVLEVPVSVVAHDVRSICFSLIIPLGFCRICFSFFFFAYALVFPVSSLRFPPCSIFRLERVSVVTVLKRLHDRPCMGWLISFRFLQILVH